MEQVFQEGFAFWSKLLLDFVLSLPYWFYIIALVFFVSVIFTSGKRNL